MTENAEAAAYRDQVDGYVNASTRFTDEESKFES